MWLPGSVGSGCRSWGSRGASPCLDCEWCARAGTAEASPPSPSRCMFAVRSAPCSSQRCSPRWHLAAWTLAATAQKRSLWWAWTAAPLAAAQQSPRPWRDAAAHIQPAAAPPVAPQRWPDAAGTQTATAQYHLAGRAAAQGMPAAAPGASQRRQPASQPGRRPSYLLVCSAPGSLAARTCKAPDWLPHRCASHARQAPRHFMSLCTMAINTPHDSSSLLAHLAPALH